MSVGVNVRPWGLGNVFRGVNVSRGNVRCSWVLIFTGEIGISAGNVW